MPEFGGIDDESKEATVEIHAANQAVEAIASGEMTLPEALRGQAPSVRERIKTIVAEGKLEKGDSAILRKARINTLLVDEDPEVALKAIKASQAEDGVGAPGTAVQVNVMPPEARALLDEEEDPQ